MLCLRVGIYSWDAWASPKRAQGGKVRATMLHASPYSTSITTSTRHTQYRSASWPLAGDRESLSRRQRKLPVPGSPGRQFRDYLLLRSPEGRTAWARVSAPRREQGKRGLGDKAGESPVLCMRLGTGTKAGGEAERPERHWRPKLLLQRAVTSHRKSRDSRAGAVTWPSGRGLW